MGLTEGEIPFDTLGMNGWHGGTLKAAAIMTTVFALGACSNSSRPKHNDSASTPQPTRSQVAPEVYRQALLAGTAPLNTALTKLARAHGYKELSSRVTDLKDAVAQAVTALGRQAPPAAVAAEHARLAAALKQFDDAVSTLGDDVDSHSLCTSSSARAELGKTDGASAFRNAAAALAAKSPDYRISLELPSAKQQAKRRLQNGQFVRSGNRAGRGTLAIQNSGESDVVVTLARSKRPAISVYVRKGKKYTVPGVTDGTYTVYFTGGSDWDGSVRGFGRDCAFQRFDDKLKFQTTRTATQIRWTSWRISLKRASDGNAPTSDVDPVDYPAT